MRCIAEFTLDSDLCLPDGSEPMVMKGPNEEFSLTLSNSKEGLARPDGVITAQLIFEAESLEDAREVAQRRLASIMNALTFTTNRKFGQSRLRRVIDWTPGLASRDALIIVEAPVWEIAEPELDQKFIDTASRMFAIQAGEQQQNALRWYRLGIQSEIL